MRQLISSGKYTERKCSKLKVLLVVVFWPEVPRREDVEGKDIWVYDGLISLWCVSNTT